MYELITKYFYGEITAKEKKLLFTAMETDAELKQEFLSVQNLRALTSWIPAGEDESVAVGKLLEFKQARKEKSFVIPYKHILGYAATVCVAVFSTWMITNRTEQPTVEEPAIAYEEFSTPSGQRALLKLHDGTTVWLNARSTLRYPNHFGKNERKVELDGEAFFEVKQNGKVPFVISTEKANIKVLGTKFNVFAYKGHEEFNTSLVEGSVKVYQGESDADALDITPHECVFLSDGKLVKSYFDNSDFLLWKEGIYAFDDVPFSYIIKKLELYYDITIIQKNKKLDQYRFSGKFRQRDGVESVLQTLQKVYYFSFVKDEENNCITIR